MVSFDKFNSKSENNFNLGIETVGFIKRKVKSFYLELCLANCIGLIFIFVTSAESIKRILKLIAVGLHSDFFLLGILIGGKKLNGHLWYLSSMLLCFTILYPLIRRWPDIMCKMVIPIRSFLLIGYLCHIYFSSTVPEISSLNNVLPNGMSDGKKIFVYYIVAFMTAILISIISRFIRKYEFLSKILLHIQYKKNKQE